MRWMRDESAVDSRLEQTGMLAPKCRRNGAFFCFFICFFFYELFVVSSDITPQVDFELWESGQGVCCGAGRA
jgi:hypothetical protein